MIIYSVLVFFILHFKNMGNKNDNDSIGHKKKNLCYYYIHF